MNKHEHDTEEQDTDKTDPHYEVAKAFETMMVCTVIIGVAICMIPIGIEAVKAFHQVWVSDSTLNSFFHMD